MRTILTSLVAMLAVGTLAQGQAVPTRLPEETVRFSTNFAMLGFGGLAQEQTVPTRRILPEDIEEASIRMVRFSTNRY